MWTSRLVVVWFTTPPKGNKDSLIRTKISKLTDQELCNQTTSICFEVYISVQEGGT